MKRLTCFILSIVIGICTISFDAKAEDRYELPHVGEIIHGFKTKEIGTIDTINSNTVLFEHQKSKAQLLYIQNDDKNRTFDISFKTPALDNSGVNHVLEHVTTSGSKNYPFKNILFTVLNQTYSSFINAYTYPNFTTYITSSLSEKQLLKLTDMYLDCVFHPSIYDDEKIFEREAWRYEKENIDTPMSIKGTVYTEMKGRNSVASASFYNTLDCLFPDSIVANNSGGKIDSIPNLTYQHVLETHKKYYNPTNALIILYGDLDYKNFLKMIDEKYLSKYNRETVMIETGEIEPLTELVTGVYEFPASSTANTENTTQIDYSYAMTGLSDEDKIGLIVFAQILNHSSSPLKQYLNQSNIDADISMSFSINLPQPVLTFSIKNTDKSKMNDLKNLVDSCMDNIIENGVDSEIVDAVISNIEFGNSMMTESSSLGYKITTSIASWWATYGNVDYFNIVSNSIKSIKQKSDQNYFENLIKTYIHNNRHSSLVATVPTKNLSEQNELKLNVQLQAKENSMSEAEMQNLIDKTSEFKKWNEKGVDQSQVKKLQAVSISELPIEIKQYPIDTKVIDGVTYITAEADVNSTVETGFVFDISSIPAEKLHYMKLFSDLLGKLSTVNYSSSNLNILTTRYLNNLSVSIGNIESDTINGYTPKLQLSWVCLDNDYRKSVDLVKEIILNTNLDDTGQLLNAVKSLKESFKSNFTQNPTEYLMYRSVASFDDSTNYIDYINNIEYYKFLSNVQNLLESSPQLVKDELKSVQDIVVNRTDLIVEFAGNKNNLDLFYGTVNSFISALPAKDIQQQDYSNLPKPLKHEAIALDSNVQYNIVSASYENMETQYSGKYIPLILAISENYLTPKLRYQNSAYSNIENVTREYITMYSYMDPSVRETFNVYSEIGEFISSFDLKQEDLNRYIVKAFGNYNMPTGELTGAINAINDKINGRKIEDRIEILNQIKSANIKDFKNMASEMDKFFENGYHGTIGSISSIKQNSNLYEQIISIED